MCTFEFPIDIKNIATMKKKLIDYYKIEIPIFVWENRVYLRISINGYNSWNDIDILIDAINKEKVYK